MKVVEKIADRLKREQMDIDNNQFGFTQGRGTTDTTFIVRQLQEKVMAKSKTKYFAV